MSATHTPDQKSSLWLWLLLLITLLLTLYVTLQSDDPIEDGIALNVPDRKVNANKRALKQNKRKGGQPSLMVVPDDLIQLDLLERNEPLQSIGNAFVPRSWYVPPPPTLTDEEEPEQIIPKAPPVPFKYVGRFDDYQLYLQEGDDLYTVEVGDTIKGLWRVEADEVGRVVMTYLPLNEQKILNKH